MFEMLWCALVTGTVLCCSAEDQLCFVCWVIALRKWNMVLQCVGALRLLLLLVKNNEASVDEMWLRNGMDEDGGILLIAAGVLHDESVLQRDA